MTKIERYFGRNARKFSYDGEFDDIAECVSALKESGFEDKEELLEIDFDSTEGYDDDDSIEDADEQPME